MEVLEENKKEALAMYKEVAQLSYAHILSLCVCIYTHTHTHTHTHTYTYTHTQVSSMYGDADLKPDEFLTQIHRFAQVVLCLYRIVLGCAVLSYPVISYCPVLCYLVILCHIILHWMVWCFVVLCCITLCNTRQHYIMYYIMLPFVLVNYCLMFYYIHTHYNSLYHAIRTHKWLRAGLLGGSQ